jgi:hypothetical protein
MSADSVLWFGRGCNRRAVLGGRRLMLGEDRPDPEGITVHDHLGLAECTVINSPEMLESVRADGRRPDDE